jgi:hypothetical protein
MKKLTFTIIFIWAVILVRADEPGKKPNNPCRVTLQNVGSLKDYTCYWKKHYEDSTIIIVNDSSIIIPGSGGAPDGAEFWAINKKTKKSTDTIRFANHYSPDYVLILAGVNNDSIQYKTTELSNENRYVETSKADTGAIANKDIVADAEKSEKKHYSKIILLCAGAALAAGLLLWLYFRRRKKQTV